MVAAGITATWWGFELWARGRTSRRPTTFQPRDVPPPPGWPVEAYVYFQRMAGRRREENQKLP
jgi:hypothetical protein